MFIRSKWSALAVVLALATTSQAWAARAARPQGAQLTQGWVVGVQRGNGQPGFSIRLAGPNQRAAVAGNPNGVAQNAQRFLVGPGTRFEAAQGMSLVPASFAALRSGQRVLIESQGPQATRVRIFPRNHYVGRARRGMPVVHPAGTRRVTSTAMPQTIRAAAPLPAVRAAKTPAANHHARNIVATTATHVKSGKR